MKRPRPRPAAPLKPSEPAFFSAQISEARRFYLDLNPRTHQRLTVVCGGSEHCRPEYHMRRSDFRYHSIELVARGEGLLKLKDKEFHLTPGSIFAYGPRVAHEIQCDPERPLVKYFVDFVGRSAPGLLAAPGPSPGQLVQSSNPDQILRLFEDLISAGLRHTPFGGRICSLILEHLLLRIAETAVTPGTVGALAFETYQRCHRYIQERFLELRGMAEAAEHCQVDPAYLCRLFGRFDHETPYHYLTRLKMMEAAERLQTPGVLVKQVADQMGFGDPFRFSRTFRRVLGVSPRRFANLQISPR